MNDERPFPELTSDERRAVQEYEHIERMDRARRAQREYYETREATFSAKEAWHRLLEGRKGVENRELRRAALNIIEDAERAEAAQRASEARYRTLFESIDEGFCIIGLLFDRNEQPVDFRFIEANPAFERHTGLVNAIGRTMRELVPNYEEHWFMTYGRVALTGQPERFESRSAALGRDYDAYACRTGEPHERKVALLFSDVTERKHREANLAFLAEVSRDLVQLANVDETMRVLGAKMGAHFGLSLCTFVEIDEAAETAAINYSWQRADRPSVSGPCRVSEFISPELQRAARAGEMVVVRDTSDDPLPAAKIFAGLKSGSFLAVPLVRHGQWRFWLGAFRSEARDWREDEIELMRELTTRSWTRLERARAEEALRASRAQLAAAFEALPSGVGFVDTHGKLILSNQELQPYLLTEAGKSGDNGGVTRWRAWHPDGRAIGENGFPTARALRGEKVVPGLEMLYSRNDGSEVWTLVSSVPVRNAEGRIIGAVNVVTDIDALKRTQEAVRQSEERYRSIVNQNIAGILQIDLEGNVLFANQQFCLRLVRPLEELLELNLRDFIHPDDLAESLRLMRKMSRDGKPFEVEKRLLRKDGSASWVHEAITPIIGADGEIRLATVTSTKINARREAEAALQANEE